jgi:hypothetical protein
MKGADGLVELAFDDFVGMSLVATGGGGGRGKESCWGLRRGKVRLGGFGIGGWVGGVGRVGQLEGRWTKGRVLAVKRIDQLTDLRVDKERNRLKADFWLLDDHVLRKMLRHLGSRFLLGKGAISNKSISKCLDSSRARD